eukprot:TRINITY_DN10668_c0_g1_i2.p1 TRINITY_DN10668_c0_g1~~TRINITY_DN10668_c0_g1_i2.p1  ORF type:complete len:239 (+),score=15.34 TRINITY_DN10668_c0_g1_i2:85-801(+)
MNIQGSVENQASTRRLSQPIGLINYDSPRNYQIAGFSFGVVNESNVKKWTRSDYIDLFLRFSLLCVVMTGVIALAFFGTKLHKKYSKVFYFSLCYILMDFICIGFSLVLTGIMALVRLVKKSTEVPAQGCFPVVYTFVRYILLAIAVPGTIGILVKYSSKLNKTLNFFFILELVVTLALLGKACYTCCCHNEILSPHLVELEQGVYHIDEEELSKIKREVAQVRNEFPYLNEEVSNPY